MGEMPTGIRESQWVVQTVGVPIEGLWIIKARYDGIRADKPP